MSRGMTPSARERQSGRDQQTPGRGEDAADRQGEDGSLTQRFQTSSLQTCGNKFLLF